MSAAHHLYAVQEADQNPCAIPPPPVAAAGTIIRHLPVPYPDTTYGVRTGVRNIAVRNVPLGNRVRPPPASPAGCGAARDTFPFGRSASATAGCGLRISEKIAAGPATMFPFIIRHKKRNMKSKSTKSCCHSDSVAVRAIFLAAQRVFGV